jgi:hypothetical protein
MRFIGRQGEVIDLVFAKAFFELLLEGSLDFEVA